MEYESEIGRIEDQFVGLESSLSSLEGIATSFRREMESVGTTMKGAGRDATNMSRSISSSVRQAFEGIIFDGESLSTALAGIGKSVSGTVLNQALAPVQSAVGSAAQSMLSNLLGFSKDGAFLGGRVTAFAQGGVVDRPTTFPMRGGTGLMGEAGPEAIMPLARGADGRLGVRAGGGGSVSVTMNIASPDVSAFQRSRTQIAAEMGRAI